MRALFILLILLTVSDLMATTYYVANTGNDDNIGDHIDFPIQSIYKANTLDLAAGDSLLFNRGDVFVGQLNIQDSGNQSSSIYIGAYGSGEKPVLRGGNVITDWTIYTGSIYKATASGPIGLLSVDGQQQMLARHPNADWFYLDVENPSNTVTDAERIGDPNWEGANLLVMVKDWSLLPFGIAAFNSGTGAFALDAEVSTSFPLDVEYCIVNHLEALDSPGEWYQDPVSHEVYLWPVSGLSPDAHTVAGAQEEYGIFIEGNYVIVDELQIQTYRHSGIRFNNRKHIIIRNNEVSNTRLNGIYVLFGSDNTVLSNTVHQCGVYGILGFTSSHALVEGNQVSEVGLYRNISETGLGSSGGMGIRLSGDSCSFRQNRIEHIGYNGLTFGGIDCLAEQNVIKYFSKTTWDCGAIYIWSSSFDQAGSSGSIIRENLIIGGVDANTIKFPDNRAAHGIYMDNHIQNLEISDNFVAFTARGIFLHNNRNILVAENELYNNWQNDIRLTNDILLEEGEMFGNEVYQNKTFRRDTLQRNLGVFSRYSTWDFGDYDNNFYYQPYTDNTVYFTYRPDDINPEFFQFDLMAWNDFAEQDLSSVSTPFSWPFDEDYSVIYTNETESSQVFPITTPLTDFEGNYYYNDINLPPFEGKIFWQFPDCNQEIGGLAFIDSCGICAGGSTGLSPITDPEDCFTTTKTELLSKDKFKVFPNPASGSFQLSYEIESDASQWRCEIYNSIGLMVYSTPIPANGETNQIEITAALPKGWYTCLIKADNGNGMGRINFLMQ